MSTLQFPTRLPADLLVELGELTGIRWNSWELEPIMRVGAGRRLQGEAKSRYRAPVRRRR